MESIQPSLILGYHGCDHEVAKAVLAGDQELRPSSNSYDWLGSGVYFWENNPARAQEYAALVMDHSERSKGKSISRPAVVGAVIDLGYCLNLLDAEALQIVADGYERLRSGVALQPGLELPRNIMPRGSQELLLRHLDCAVIEAVHAWRDASHLQPFDTIRAAFIEGEPLYPNAGFAARNHIQVCVRSPRCIIGYFRPARRIDIPR